METVDETVQNLANSFVMETERKSSWKMVGLAAILHMLCCGLPLLLLSGLSFTFLIPSWPVIGISVAVLGVGFTWYLRRINTTYPSNEGKCKAGCRRDSTETKSSTVKTNLRHGKI